MNNRLPLLSLAISLSVMLTACNSSSSSSAAKISDLSTSQRTALNHDMALLDQPYVTALFYSNMKASGPLFADAKNTLGIFGDQWKSFKKSHEKTLTPTSWSSGFSDVDTDIATASSHYGTITSFPANLVTAHLAMEDVREVMGKMRTGVELNNYFMDQVTDTHHKMGPVSGAYAAYSASTDSAAVDQLKSALIMHLPTFVAAVKQLKADYGDGTAVATLYELSANKSSRLSRSISNADSTAPGLLQIVTKLTQALADNNDANIIKLASKVKGKFVSIFLSFGDFMTPYKKDIIAVQKSIIPMLYCTGNPPNAGAVCLNGSSNPKDGTLSYIEASTAALAKFKAHVPSNAKTNVPRLLGWEGLLTTIDSKLAEASASLSSATDLATAKNSGTHLSTEAVRDSFYNLVATYEGQTTVMTRLDEYHAVFEKILPVVIDGNVTNADVEIIKGLMPNLQTAFDNLSSQVLSADKEAWGVTGVNLESMLSPQQANIKKLNEELSAFSSTNDNGATISQKAIALKKLYIPLFTAFGAF